VSKTAFTTESQRTQSIAARHGGIEEKTESESQIRSLPFLFRLELILLLFFEADMPRGDALCAL
jgi:hypothetical protein